MRKTLKTKLGERTKAIPQTPQVEYMGSVSGYSCARCALQRWDGLGWVDL